MATTQIKRLYQNNTEFVPITLSEAVVVNTDNMSIVDGYGITTLDKVLRGTLNVVGQSADDIDILEKAVDTINTSLSQKQDILTPGTGIQIVNGVISLTTTATLYQVVTTLPEASEECSKYIYIKLNENGGAEGNWFTEYICVKPSATGRYIWEEIGSILTEVNLDGYLTKSEFNTKISQIETTISNIITAEDITLSNNTQVKVVVDYVIPNDLYDSMVNADLTDNVVGGK